MAITLDQLTLGTNADGSSASSIALTTTNAVASNGFIIVGVACWGNVDLSSVAGGSLSWSIDKGGTSGSPQLPHVWIASAQAPSGLASSTSITATFSGATQGRMIGGISFTGVATSSPVDGTPVGVTGSAVAAWSTASMTLTAGSVAVAICDIEANTTNTASEGSEAWEAGTGGDKLVLQYRIESSAGSYTLGGTWGSATGNNNCGVAYLADSGAVTTTYQSLQPTAGGRW